MTNFARIYPRRLNAAVVAVALLGVGLGASACSGKAQAQSNCSTGVVVVQGSCAGPGTISGDIISPPWHEDDITMTDTKGAAYNIEKANPGKTVLLYFGYTHCPFLCPTIMADVASALRQLDPAERAKFAVVFITVDPNRDTPTVLSGWLHRIDPNFIGLRAPIKQVIAAQKKMHVPISHVISGKKYTVQHSAELLVLTPDHENHVVYTYGPQLVTTLKHDLPLIAANQDWQ